MPTDGSARRVLSVTMGISAMLDLTGATIFRVVRPVLPDPPPPGSRPDPFRAAMDTIMAAHREVVAQAPDETIMAARREVVAAAPDESPTPDESGVTLATWPKPTAARGPGAIPTR
jgi:hypothetical protein